MSVTPKITDLNEINELMQLIKELESKVEHQQQHIDELRSEYKMRLSQEESIMANKLITQKKVKAFKEAVDELSDQERIVLDSFDSIKSNIEQFITDGGLTEYIDSILSKHKDASVIAGDDVKKLAPKNAEVVSGQEGFLRVKVGEKQYIFDPAILKHVVFDKYVSQLVAMQ